MTTESAGSRDATSVRFTFQGRDGFQIAARKWVPSSTARAVVLLLHGAAEHSARYEEFAASLVRSGFAVYAEDHRGHGETSKSPGGEVGFFAERDGWELVLDDLSRLSALARGEHPDAPVFLFAHSMGSFLGRALIARERGFSGAVLSGTAGHPGLLGFAGRFIIARELKKHGPRAPSPMLSRLTFGGFNKQFEPSRTAFDWLSRDPAVVDRYVADPLCGFVSPVAFFRDLLYGTLLVNSKRVFADTPKELPVLLMSGARDPVGKNGKGVHEVARRLRAAGVREVTVTIYPECRHECLNELNREQVYHDVAAWIDAHLNGGASRT